MEAKEQTVLHRFFDTFRPEDSLLILTHDHPDPDSISSAAALREIARVFGHKKTTVAYGGIIGRSENAHMVKYLKLRLYPFEEIRSKKFNKLALLDTQPQTGNNALPKGWIPDLVIDHHPMIRPTQKVPFVDIRTDYGATASILAEYLFQFDLVVEPALATALLYGIKSETQDLGREASKADMDQYLKLFPVANKRLLVRIVNSRVPRGYFFWLQKGIQNAEIAGNVIVTRVGPVDSPDMIPEVADLMLRMEGTVWVLCMGEFRKAIHLSVRTTNPRKNAGALMKRLLRGRGNGGGHGLMAGGRIDVPGLEPWQIHEAENELQEQFLKLLRKQDRARIPLLANGEEQKKLKAPAPAAAR